ncbi:Ldh family oxidoreductase [Sodalis ligni]|uniref:LDH2 family malate/lactate/ureidoglycolate dehydrogenase n=1 Tax=Sodalis ligni TaxID=2697027 RepID=A0A4R1N6T3_9GAMM|nr:Ldh family oxidoreductase [Sodalis ligni]TCL02964.1 LDH2 family malate/lactate/ureidoglycolate dehydrogenase [Sodalis ligni]
MAQLSLDDTRALAHTILRHHGFSEDQAAAIADTMAAGQRDECASHGLYRLLGCIATLKAGKAVANAQPETHDIAPALLKVDAKGGFSPLAFRRGLSPALEKARQNGLAAFAINHCVHFSALWVEIEEITAAGMVALACTPSHAWVAPAGGSNPLFGTNPFAFGWPRAGQLPFVFDFATSAIARGEIELHRREGKPVPPGWGIDDKGQPTTDAAAILAGAMLTFGGHKGSALSAMIELIAGPLIGDFTSAESRAWDNGAGALPYHGELIIIIDPRRFLGAQAEEHLARAEPLFAAMAQNGRLPSQRRYEARQRSLAQGITLPDALYRDLLALLD